MVITVFIIGLILILPLILTFYGYLSVKGKRLYFALYLFGKIKLISGYVKLRDKGGFYIHLSDSKAIIIDINTLKKLSGGPNLFSDVEFDELYLITDLGVKNFSLLYTVLTVNSAIKNFACITKARGFLPKIISDLNIYNQNDGLKSIKIKFIFSFNLVCILKSIIANYSK
jgi:hypothetical protein